MTKELNTYEALRAVNVSEQLVKTEGGFSYLPWAVALDLLLKQDPLATYAFGEPKAFGANTLMVFCTVNALGKSMTAQLPVIDEVNCAISNPDAMMVNTSMQRALVKAIALHGLGLEVYSKDGLPSSSGSSKAQPAASSIAAVPTKATPAVSASDDAQVMSAVTARISAINASNDLPRLAKTKMTFKVGEPGYKSLMDAVDKRVAVLQKQIAEQTNASVGQAQAEAAQEALAA